MVSFNFTDQSWNRVVDKVLLILTAAVFGRHELHVNECQQESG